MNLIRTFRILVAAATACYVVWFLLPYGASDLEQRIAEYSGHGAVLPIHHSFYYGAWFTLWLVAALGLVLLHNWGRHLYLALSLLGIVVTPFSGYLIQPPLDTMFSSANLLLDGVVLAMAYLSPVAASFKESSRNKKKKRGS